MESRKRFLWPFLWEPWFCGRNFGSKSVAASCGVGVLRGEISQSSAQYYFFFKSSCVVIACDCLTPGRCFTQMHNDGVGVRKPGTKHFGSTKQCIVVCTVGGGLLLFSDWAEGILGFNSTLLYCNVAKTKNDDLM